MFIYSKRSQKISIVTKTLNKITCFPLPPPPMPTLPRHPPLLRKERINTPNKTTK